MKGKHRILIKHRWGLGDTILLTALVRDIHRAYPGQYEVGVNTHFTNVWWNNPYITDLAGTKPTPMRIDVSWVQAIHWNAYARLDRNQKRMCHILAWYHYDFERRTGLKVPVTDPWPDLHLTADEAKPRVSGRYWVVVAGGKQDITNKYWWSERYQAVVDALAKHGIPCVQVGATHNKHNHPPLSNCLNLVGKTDNARDLFAVIKHADGVICPVTGAMHIAAAYQRPCVVIAGGREEPWFEWYGNGFQAFGPDAKPVETEHRFLHTIGQLSCCDVQGCWKKRTVPLEPIDLGKKKNELCKTPVRRSDHAVAKCMDLITVDHVVEAVMDHYDQNILPPIGKPKPRPAAPPPDKLTFVAEEPPEGISPPPPVKVPQIDLQPPPSLADLGLLPTLVRQPSVASHNQRPAQTKPPVEMTRTGPRGRKFDILDNPIIGGRYTVCVLLYGDHADLAKRCLDSILTTVERGRIELRVACNAVSPDTLAYLDQVEPDRVYVHQNNDHKYPVMRQMFHDAAAPLRTPYLIWFDDDAWVVEPRWIVRLSEAIIANHKHGVRLYGAKMYHDFNAYREGYHNPAKWFHNGSWYRGRHFRVKGGNRSAPNGSCIDFVPGWFWCIGTDAIRAADIPDIRLDHNGGDITIGAQITQAGFKIKEFNRGKCFVSCPPKQAGGRRVGGYEESFPWVAPSKRFARTFKL